MDSLFDKMKGLTGLVLRMKWGSVQVHQDRSLVVREDPSGLSCSVELERVMSKCLVQITQPSTSLSIWLNLPFPARVAFHKTMITTAYNIINNINTINNTKYYKPIIIIIIFISLLFLLLL